MGTAMREHMMKIERVGHPVYIRKRVEADRQILSQVVVAIHAYMYAYT
jgi:hypothetical protein